jgi:branched-chain amino acid transport system ATP-binding protein
LSVLSLTGVSAGHAGRTVLRDIRLELAEGEVLAVLGRNGAGKTTLLHTILSLEPAWSGDLRVKGRDVRGWPTHRIARLGVALVPQGRGAFPSLTVQENLRLATLAGRASAWSLERVWASFPRLAERRSMSGAALSGGERQMLAIARALLTGADTLLLDEPSEGLAPMAVEEVIVGLVRRLAADGVTVMLAEQNVAMALGVATRAAVLAEGGIVFDGPPGRLAADRDLQSRHLGV